MSTADVWFDETEIEWSTHRVASLGPSTIPAKPRRTPSLGWLGLFAVLALAVAGGLAFVDLGGDAGVGTAPPLRAPEMASADPSPATVTLDAIAHCESRGDPTAVSQDGVYRGKYQFDMATWQSVGGAGDPARAPEREQDRRAQMLAAERGTAPWPSCAGAAAG